MTYAIIPTLATLFSEPQSNICGTLITVTDVNYNPLPKLLPYEKDQDTYFCMKNRDDVAVSMFSFDKSITMTSLMA